MGDMFDMGHSGHLFVSEPELQAQAAVFDGFAWTLDGRRYLPLYEGKHVWHFDHRYATGQGMPQDKTRSIGTGEHDDPQVEIQTRHYVAETEVSHRLKHRTTAPWLLGWRKIARATDQRTVIISAFARTAVGSSLKLMHPQSSRHSVALLASLSSLVCDYAVRQKQSGANVMKFIVMQAPVPNPDTYAQPATWQPALTLQQWLEHRVVELVYTSSSLQPWAQDVGDAGAPFRWDPTRRAVLQAEIDAGMFHVYGLDREQTWHVIGTFRALRDAETRTYGEFRTERLVLAEYDRMAAAIADGGVGWVSMLDVPAGRGPRHLAHE
jgi:hypothetical protein